nr:Gldg family protein [uncultured Sellimonas sp.]
MSKKSGLKEKFRTVQTRKGFYSIGMIAVVLVIAVVINLIAGQLPENMKQIDVSDKNIYGISKKSKSILKDLKYDIDFTVYAQKSNTDERIKTFLDKYTKLTDKINVKWVDPVAHPQALQENKDAQSNSIVVSCKETNKNTTVAFSDIFVADMSSYYTTGSTSYSEFDADGQLTSAINQVTSDVQKKVYRTAGHGEASLSTSMEETLGKSNITVEEINLLMKKEIPSDCDLILIDAPTSDISVQEKDMLLEYMKNGGDVFYIMGDAMTDTPNLNSFMEQYGMKKVDGYIADTERSYQGNYYYIFPEISASGTLADGLESNMVLMINSAGFKKMDDLRDTLTVDTFMTTSDQAYAVTEDKQTQGEYALGAVATEDKAKLTVLASESMINAQVTDYFSNLDNSTLFVNMVMDHFDDVENVSVKAKSLTVQPNTVQHAGGISTLLIFVIPAAVLLGGFIFWMKRRKA